MLPRGELPGSRPLLFVGKVPGRGLPGARRPLLCPRAKDRTGDIVGDCGN